MSLGLLLSALLGAHPGVGSLIVDTSSSTTTIDAKRLGWNKIHKGAEPFIAPRVPAGEHRLTFCNEYKCIDYRARIRAGALLALHVDFEPAEVADVSAEHRSKMKKWQSDCRSSGDRNACQQACQVGSALASGKPTAACTILARLDRAQIQAEDPGVATEAANRGPPLPAPVESSPVEPSPVEPPGPSKD